jgi:chemotaxis protein CheC
MSAGSITRQTDLFVRAADDASQALSRWLGRPTRIAVRRLEALPLERAVGVLGVAEGPLVACAMRISGSIAGILVLACDDVSGLTLADMLLGRPPGSSTEWGELETSAAVETANIIGCAYLNTMTATAAATGSSADATVLPTPPWFVRDFAAAVMEGIMLSQALQADTIFLTHTDFVIEDTPVTCSLLFVPEAGPPAPSGG